MKKILFLAILISLALISACAPQQNAEPVQSAMPVPAQGGNSIREAIVIEDTSAKDSVVAEKGNVREFDIVAKQFEFMPDTIEVNAGDRVKITLTSADVTHGFSINEYNIDERITPGQPTVVEFTANKKGTFTFYCSVFCGSGHGKMRGTLIVK